jgi:hypothetical protein
MWAWPWSSKWVSVAGFWLWLWLMAVGIKKGLQKVHKMRASYGAREGLEPL